MRKGRRPGGLLRFLRDERASSEVEYLLLTGFVVLPLTLVIPPLLVAVDVWFFDRLSFWLALPFP